MSDVITFNTENNSWQTFPQNDFICSGKGLGELSRTMMKPKMLEIGCDVGDTAEFMLRSHPMLHLTSIDPYENYVDWNGIWVLDFTVPVYTWLHKVLGLGWIYD